MFNRTSALRKTFIIALLCTSITGSAMLAGCSSDKEGNEGSDRQIVSSSGNTSAQNSSNNSSNNSSSVSEVSFNEEDVSTEYDESGSTSIKLNGTSAEIKGSGASVEGNTVKITAAGTYILSGKLTGQVIISAGKNDVVKLVLDNAGISSTDTAAIYAEKCEKTILLLNDDTENTLSDGSNYVSDTDDDSESDSPNAAVYCKDDLTILGNGSLTVTGNARNGITSKDILRISSGTITVNAVHNGITGRDNLAVEGGKITVTTKDGDGLRSTYSDTDDNAKGHITLDNADITVNSGSDGIQAEKTLTVNSGTITVKTGSGAGTQSTQNQNQGGFGRFSQSNSNSSSDESVKGLKAGTNITINGGTINIDSYDDAIHSNGDAIIKDGTFNIKAGDDGIHADTNLSVSGGTITVSQSYEGLEAIAIDISGGTVDITASDDGINAAGGNDGSGFGNFDNNMDFGGRRFPQNIDQNNNAASTVSYSNEIQVEKTVSGTDDNSISTALNISDGTVYVNAQGDGLDSNGALNISGGMIVVNGTTQEGNGIIDHDGSCTVTGGTLIGAGTSDMLELPGDASTQKTVAVLLSQTQEAGKLVYITNSSGNVIAAMSPEKSYGCLVFSSADLKENETYTVYTGGTASGDSTHGCYSKASVSGGTQYTTFTVSNAVTYVDQNGVTSYSGNMGGRGNMGGMTGQTPGRMSVDSDSAEELTAV